MYEFNILESIDDIKNEFAFLESEYNFTLIEKKSTNKGITYHYSNNMIRINLNYDYRENFFYFSLISGKDTQYPNDSDFKNIKPFFKLIQKYDQDFNLNKLQPDVHQYKEALKLNVKMLKKYGDKVLRGEEWF